MKDFFLEFDKKKFLHCLLHALSDTVADDVLLALIETHILSIIQQRSTKEKQILFNYFFEDGFDDFKKMVLACLNEENPSKKLLGAFLCSLLVDIIPQEVSDIKQEISLWQLPSALCRICHSDKGMRIFQWLRSFYLQENVDFFTCILEEETNSKRCVAWMQEVMKMHVKSKEVRHYWLQHLVDIESSEIDSYIKNVITYFHCLDPMERLLWLPIWRNVLLQRRDISAQEMYRLLLVLQSCKDNTQLGHEVFFDLQRKVLSLEAFTNHFEPIFSKENLSLEGLDRLIQELAENQNLAKAYDLIIFCMINNIKCDEKAFLQHLSTLDNDRLSQLIVKMKKTVDGIAESVNYQPSIYQFFFDILDCLVLKCHYGAVNFGESLHKVMKKTNLIEKWIYTFSKFECLFTDWKEAKSDVLLKGHHQVFKFCLDFLQKREFATAFLYFDRLINYLREKIKVERRTALLSKEPEEVQENAVYPWEEDSELEQDLKILECEMTCNLTSMLEVVFDSKVRNLRKKLLLEEQEIERYSKLFFRELLSIHDRAADDIFSYCITFLKQLESYSSKNLRDLTCQLQTQYLAEIAIRGSKKTQQKGIILGINWVKNEKNLELWVQLINCIAVLAPLTAAKDDRIFKTSVQKFLNEHSFEIFKAIITNYEVLIVLQKKLETKDFELKVISNDNYKSLLSSAKQSFAALIAIEQNMIAKWLYEKTIESHLEHYNDAEKNELLSLLCQQADYALQNDDLAVASSIILSALNYWPGIAVSKNNKEAINTVICICLQTAKKQSQMIKMMPVFLKIDKALFINTYDDDILWFIKHTHKTKKWEECSKFLEMKNIDFEKPKKELQKIAEDCLSNNVNNLSVKGNQTEKEALITRLIKIAIDYKIKDAAVLKSFVNVLFRYDNDSLKCSLLNYLSSLLLQETKENFYLIFAKLHWSLSILETKDENVNVSVLMKMYSKNVDRFTKKEIFLFLSYMAPAIMRIEDEKTFVEFFLLTKKFKEKDTYIPTEETYNKIDRHLVEGYLKKFSIAKENCLFPPFLGYSYIQKVEVALKIKENTLSFFKTIINAAHSSNGFITILIALIFRELIENKKFEKFPEYIDLLMTKTETEDEPPLEDMALLAFIYLVEDKEWGVKQIKNMHKKQTDNLEQLIIKASEKTELKVSYNDDKKNTFPTYLLLNEEFNFLFKTKKMLIARSKLYSKFISKIEEKLFLNEGDASKLPSNKLEENICFLLEMYVNCLKHKKRNLNIFKEEKDADFRRFFTKINKDININVCMSNCLFAFLEKASLNNFSQTKSLFPIALENMIYCHKLSTNEDIEKMYKYISYISNTFSARLIKFFDKNISHIMRSKNFECLTKLITYFFDKSSVRGFKKYEIEKK